MKLAFASATGAIFGAASQSPKISVDLTPIIIALLGLLGALAAAGVLMNRSQRKKADAETRALDAQVPMSHAQYEGFIAEAAQRIQSMGEVAITRLEAELARASQRIAELETELEKVKSDRERNITAAMNRERELRAQISELHDTVVDLERRLEAHGVPTSSRRRGDKRRRAKGGEEEEEPE